MDFSSRRTQSPYDALAGRAAPVAVTAGASSYFTAPTATLDPSLFSPDEQLLPGVRRFLLDTIYRFLRVQGFVNAPSWSTPWIAGSGASYQWSAARDPGDLDILIGVDYVPFREANPMYARLSDVQIGETINERLKADLWPATADQRVGDGRYEVTWYVNPKSTDIRAINPYAAYNVLQNNWTVRPVELPADGPLGWFPKEWHAAADSDEATAKRVTQAYDAAILQHQAARTDGARRNALARLTDATKRGAELFDDIHLGRKKAFSDTGEGYRDFHNFRWQSGKQRGTVQALGALKKAQSEAQQDAETALYGRPLADANTSLRRALGG